MLDPRFGYRREAIDGLPARQSLVRDRYHVLWDVYVEARLHRRGLIDESMTKRLEELFRQVFALDDTSSSRDAFRHVFHAGPRMDSRSALTHRRLLDWANSPETLFADFAKAAGSKTTPPRTSGEACPSCAVPDP